MHPVATIDSHRTTLRKTLLAVGATMALCAGFVNGGAPAAHAVDTKIDILSFGDFHGRLQASGTIAGAAVMAGAIDTLRAANPNTLVACGGDSIGASTFPSFIDHDTPTINAINVMKPDACALGNHEFDQGRSDVDSRVIPSSTFPYLAANLYDKATGLPAYKQYSISVVDGVRVGFIGAMTNSLASVVSPAAIATLDVKPLVPEVNRVADALEAAGSVDVIILVVHEGASSSSCTSATDGSALGKIVNGVNAHFDAIINAHSHLTQDCEVVLPGRTLALPVIQAGAYSRALGDITMTYDKVAGELTSISSKILPLTNPDGSPLRNPDGSYTYPRNSAVNDIVTKAVADSKVKGEVKVGDVTASFNRARELSGESTLSNFVADVQLWATAPTGAQIAIMNPGGLRSDLAYKSSGAAADPDGNVMFSEAANVQPFANTLVTMDLTGAQLKEVLEQQWQPAGTTGPFLKLGLSKALTYTYDPTAPRGSRITRIMFNGASIAPTDTFRVAANSFLASGGDNFTTLGAGTNRADSGKVDLTAMVDYFTANPVAAPDYAQRAVGVQLSAPSAAGYRAGDRITLTLSSLGFTAGEPQPKSVEVLYRGTMIGESTIDPAVVSGTDDSGRATLSVTIPSGGEAGLQELLVRVPDTGTQTTVPIRITALPPAPGSALSDGNAGSVTAAPSTVKAGDTVQVRIPGFDGRQVTAYSYGPMVPLGAFTVTGAQIIVRIPAGSPAGVHKIAVFAGDGSVIGWASITVTARR